MQQLTSNEKSMKIWTRRR